MSEIVDRATEFVTSGKGDVWNWFNTLNREEWLVVLAVTCACGFMAMLGYRSRSM